MHSLLIFELLIKHYEFLKITYLLVLYIFKFVENMSMIRETKVENVIFLITIMINKRFVTCSKYA